MRIEVGARRTRLVGKLIRSIMIASTLQGLSYKVGKCERRRPCKRPRPRLQVGKRKPNPPKPNASNIRSCLVQNHARQSPTPKLKRYVAMGSVVLVHFPGLVYIGVCVCCTVGKSVGRGEERVGMLLLLQAVDAVDAALARQLGDAGDA